MQRDDQRPPAAGRPSLLSSEPEAGAGRASVFAGLERPAGGVAAQAVSRRGKLAAIGVGVAFLAAGAVGVSMLMSATPDVALTLPPAVAAAPAATAAPALATTAPAATTPAAIAAAPPAAAPQAPAATIVEDTAAVVPPVPASRPAKPARDELTAALERPHAPAKAKVAEHKKAEKPAKKPVQVAKKNEAKAVPPDSDVTLLAALMAHVQTNRPAKDAATPGSQLKQCARLNDAGAAQCRERLCATTARKEPECKQQPVAVKTASES